MGLLLETAKHRVDMRCKRSHVGHHHHDVRGLQLGVCVQPRQDVVMQHLDFTLGRMGLHELKAGVGLAEQSGGCGRCVQAQDGRLQGLQHAGLLSCVPCFVQGVDEQVDPLKRRSIGACGFKVVDGMKVVAAMLAPGSQQGVALRNQAFCEVAPVFAAGVVDKHQHRDEAPQGHQGF